MGNCLNVSRASTKLKFIRDLDSICRLNGVRPLRIGFVSIQDASDVTTWSGIPFQILKQLRAQGIQVEVFSPLSPKVKYVHAAAKILAKARSKSVTLDHFPVVLRSYARQIEAHLRERPVDVIVSTSTIPITLLRCKQPIVVWTDAVFHSMIDYYDGAFANLTKRAKARGKLQEETALQRCTLVAYSSTWAIEAAKKHVDASKLRLLPFGSSLPVQHTAEEVATQARQKRVTRHNKCELLFVGVDWERKGGEIAIETARLLNDAGIETRLRVVGSHPPAHSPDFVECLGFINKSSPQGLQRLAELFQSADFFILPTKAEAAGIVFCEACAFGVPPLTYATGGTADYVRTGLNGVCFAPGAPASEFAARIQKLLSNPAEYEALSAGAFMEYKNRLNWEKSVQQLVQFCELCRQA